MSENRDHPERRILLSRRKFLRTGGLAASGLLLFGCAAGSGSDPTDGRAVPDSGPELSLDSGRFDAALTLPSDAVLLGLFPTTDAAGAREAVRQVCAALDWSWLSTGDSVFVKVSCNSGHTHPAVTSPNAVRALCAELQKRGAGKILVGDQAGVEAVRLAPGDKLFGSTRDVMQGNGLLAAIEESGGTPHFFEEHGYEDGYFPATMDVEGHHWTAPPQIAKIIKDVDHIVTLPRLSSHIIAGYSHGHKCAVGWLRDDSRYLLHFEGASLHEKYAELNYTEEIRSRHRLTLTLAEKLLLDSGPDQGTIAQADPAIVIASPHMANHDALAVALLAHIDSLTPEDSPIPMKYGPEADTFNQLLVTMLIPTKYGEPWGSREPSAYTPVPFHEYWKGIESDRSLSRAYEILGGIPEQIQVRMMGEEPDSDLFAYLKDADGGIFKFEG